MKLLPMLAAFTTLAIAASHFVRQAEAACSGLPATPGNDTIACDATAPATTPFFNTGAGNDSIVITGGTITANPGDVEPGGIGQVSIRQEAGADRLEISAGTVDGAVVQGNDVDTFIMSGGQINALTQGSGLDFATISGGRIVGLFFAGDDVTMSGGQVGTMDLEQANNILRLSGGQIDTDVLAQQGRDTLIMSGGTIGGTVNFRNGDNNFTITGGSIGGNVQSGTGIDSFTWDGGGTIGGSVTLGDNNDTAMLRNLTGPLLGATVVDGETGTDTLTFDATTATWAASKFLNWENVNLTNGTVLTANGAITLGDAGTGTGTLRIDASSTLFAANASFAALNPATPATLVNAGAIDLTNSPGAGDTFTVNGQYTGNGGRVVLDTVLGSDGSLSDRLVLATAPATGTTGLAIRNAGGPGALTTADGILVVEEQNGASPGNAFTLAEPVGVGAFDYLLFQGNVAGTQPNNWYLRSQRIDTGPDPEPPVPFIRPEVAVQTAVPPLARELVTTMLGTFHERRGEQALLGGQDGLLWARGFGQYLDMSWNGTVDPSFKGTIFGFQAGADLYRHEGQDGEVATFGLFLGYGRLDGDVRGFADGERNVSAGSPPLDGYSLGLNAVLVGPERWYLDAVLMGTLIDGDPHSDRGLSSNLDGEAFTASLEAGYPIPLNANFALEPQAQVIWQSVELDDSKDDISKIKYDLPDAFTGRIGLRLTGDFAGAEGGAWQPYLKANLWYSPSDTDTVRFDADKIKTKAGTTAVELGAGIVTKISDRISLFGTGDYLFDIAGQDKETVEGNLGLQLTW